MDKTAKAALARKMRLVSDDRRRIGVATLLQREVHLDAGGGKWIALSFTDKGAAAKAKGVKPTEITAILLK